MLTTMNKIGIPIEKHHHEVAVCQMELGFVCRELVECADMLMAYKYVVKNVAKAYGKTATFMPKPLFGQSGSGCHMHQSLWKDGANLFWDSNGSYLKLSQIALWYIGGLLKHAGAVFAFTNPTVNSYKRLVPGYEAPANLCYSKGNRSAAVRVPLCDSENPKAKRIEFRCPDGAACPYLSFSAAVLAGIDGIKNKINPGPPMDTDMYHLSGEEKARVLACPGSLSEALDALEKDMDFLTVGDVFSKEFILEYIKFKRAEEKSILILPHPKEFETYYHC